jgi:transcriptional regulator with XRE-family HTH domain
MELRGETKASLARKIETSPQSVAYWLTGKRNPKRPSVVAMAKALQCNIEEIAEPQNDLEAVAISGDKFAQYVIDTEDQDELTGVMMKYLSEALTVRLKYSSQTDIAKQIGLSTSQVNRIVRGLANLKQFPIGSLLKLCPQIIKRDIVDQESENQSLRQECHNVLELIDNSKLEVVVSFLKAMAKK